MITFAPNAVMDFVDKQSPGQREGGFTLIELLATIVILGVIMGPMVQSYVFAWQTSLDATRRSQAVMLANWKIEELRSSQGYAEVSSEDFSSCSLPSPYAEGEKGAVDFDCETNVEEVTGVDPNFAAKKVSVTISYPSITRGGRRTINCADVDTCDVADYATYITKLVN